MADGNWSRARNKQLGELRQALGSQQNKEARDSALVILSLVQGTIEMTPLARAVLWIVIGALLVDFLRRLTLRDGYAV